MPYVSLGCGSGQKSPYGVSNATQLWIAAGGVGIDTAYNYGNQADIAAGLKAAGVKRSDVFITSKIPPGSYEKAKQDIASNLKDLDMDQVDLMLMHYPCDVETTHTNSDGGERAGCSTSDTWKALTEAKAAGKTRAIGVSHFTQKDLEGLSSTPSVNQCSYSVEEHDDATIDYCKSKGIVYQSFSPLCGGANGSSCTMRGGKSVLIIPEVISIASAHKVSAAQVALKWITERGSPLACASWRSDYMDEDLDLWSWGNLTATEMRTLNKIHPGAISALL
jgi:diketogulonate reductase-like aldo/keto reductase